MSGKKLFQYRYMWNQRAAVLLQIVDENAEENSPCPQ